MVYNKAIDKEKLPQPFLTFDWLSESREPDARHFDSNSTQLNSTSIYGRR